MPYHRCRMIRESNIAASTWWHILEPVLVAQRLQQIHSTSSDGVGGGDCVQPRVALPM